MMNCKTGEKRNVPLRLVIAMKEYNMVQKGFTYQDIMNMDIETFEIFAEMVRCQIERENAEMPKS